MAGYENPHDEDGHSGEGLLVLVEDTAAEQDAAVGLLAVTQGGQHFRRGSRTGFLKFNCVISTVICAVRASEK